MKKLESIKLGMAGMMILMSLGVMASSLNLRMAHPGIYDVYIDGNLYTVSGNHLRVDNLRPGHKEIQIIHHNRDPRRNVRTASRLVYRDRLHMPARTRVDARFGRNGMNVNYAPLQRNHPTQCVAPPVAYDAPVYGMHPQDFDQLMFSLDQTAFDRTKMDIARLAIRNNGITTQQLASIMESLSFDSHRLDLAKFAYGYCADQMNYYQLASIFTFESNARRLMNYIS